MNLRSSSKRGVGVFFKSCDISLKNTPTSHPVSLAPLNTYACGDSGMLFCREFAYAITENSVCLYLLVPPLAHAVLLFDASVLAHAAARTK